MHYVGMAAFRLPVPVAYDWPTALVSFVPSFFASALGLSVVSRRKMGPAAAITSSFLMGAGIAALHYTGMASMRLQAMCQYSPPLVSLSVLLAIAISLLSLWLMFLLRDEAIGRRLRRAASALLMGVAISVMHYTGMASASFTPSADVPDLAHAVSVSFLGTAGIGLVSLTVLVVAIVTVLVDRLQLAAGQLRALAARLQALREQERIRIAREIHDDLGQKLTGLKMDLLWTERKLGEL